MCKSRFILESSVKAVEASMLPAFSGTAIWRLLLVVKQAPWSHDTVLGGLLGERQKAGVYRDGVGMPNTEL